MIEMKKINEYPGIPKELKSVIDEKSPDELAEMIDHAKGVMSYYRCAMLEIVTKFEVLNEQFSLSYDRNPIESIKSRLKSVNSIHDKLLRKNLPFTIMSITENLYDIAGVRVICSYIDDIYLLADCLLQQDDITLVEMKDYISEPKANGYRSLHLIVEIPIFLCDEKKYVKVEVQLRTISMESWANLEHQMRYKKKLDDELLAKTEGALLECAEACYNIDLKMQSIRNYIEEAQSEDE